MASRFAGPGQPYEGLAAGGRWIGKVLLRPGVLERPFHWRKPRTAFLDMGDLFHERVPDEYILRVLETIRACHVLGRGHRFLLLTKRTERMRGLMKRLRFDCGSVGGLYGGRKRDGGLWLVDGPALGDVERHVGGVSFAPILSNMWPGVSAEDQRRADERIPVLLDTPAVHRWLSLEPLLGPVDLRGRLDAISWVVVGGEAGPGARPCSAGWIRDIVRQCKDARVPVFVKQLGSLALQRLPDAHETGPAVLALDKEWPVGTRFGNPTGKVELNGRVVLLRDRSGADMAEWPAELRVRDTP